MSTPGTAREQLRRHQPDLLAAYDAAVPDARAAVLARLWGALAREPIPGLGARRSTGGVLRIALPDGGELSGDAAAAEPFAPAPAGFALRVHDASAPGGAAGTAYRDPAALLNALGLPGDVGRLAAELDDSVANLALARAARPAPTGGRPWLVDLAAMAPAEALAAAEQVVVDGHPLHPCCRTRMGMSVAEVLAYAPEHRRLVGLQWYAVPAGRWLSTGTGLPPRLVVHPWQRDHVLDAQRYGLRPVEGTVPARPLMSLRTLAPLDDPGHHVKTAVDVQMTSAVRIVSAAAVHNGPVLTALLAGLVGDVRRCTVLAEPAGGAVLVDGLPDARLAMVRRVAPAPGPGEVVLPLAALAAPSPADGTPVVVEAARLAYRGDPLPLFSDLVGVLLPPLLTLLHLGVALEAHGQNTLVALVAGAPTRLLYRDVGGVRVSPARLRAAGRQPPSLHGDLPTDDPDVLRTKLAAALAVALGELVAVLSRYAGADPDALWRVVARTADQVYADLPAAAAGDRAALLDRPAPVKATTAMRLADQPLADVWAYLPEPWGAR